MWVESRGGVQITVRSLMRKDSFATRVLKPRPAILRSTSITWRGESLPVLNRNQYPFRIGINGRFASECAVG